MALLPRGAYETEIEQRQIRGGSTERLPVLHARPTGMPRLGLVLLPDIFGMRPLFDDLADRLASHGIAVAAVEPFAATPQEERETLDFEQRETLLGRLNDLELLDDYESAANLLIVEDDVAEVAVLGFCYGGHMALKAARLEVFSRAVSFYGIVHAPPAWTGPGRVEPLAGVESGCPILALVGDNDDWIPEADMTALTAAIASRGDSEVVVYPDASHGFVHDPDRPAHREVDAQDAWRRAFQFLGLS